MEESNTEPSIEMIDFYLTRTNEHIGRVRKCIQALASSVTHSEELLARGEVHDASKFSPDEFIPYVWLTEFHRCRRNGEPFQYPVGMEQMVEAAIAHHMRNNRHHPEFHADPNDMTYIDLCEMVCDWTAMAQEFEQHDGSARGWADRTIGIRILFNPQKRNDVYSIIDLLDQCLRSQITQ